MAEDRNENLWLGMVHGGTIKLARNGFTAYAEADGVQGAKCDIQR